MSETLSTKFTQQFSATLINQLPFDNVVASPALDVSVILSSGSIAGAANQLFRDQRTLAQNGTEVINFVSFNGSLDPVGQSLNIGAVKSMIISNLNGTESNSLRVGGFGSSGAWVAPFNGTNTATLAVPGGATIALSSSGSLAWPVATSASGSLLKFWNDGIGPLSYDLIVVGGTPWGQ